MPVFSAVIPIFNEEANLPELLTRLTRSLEAVTGDFEAILVDDGSNDRSATLVAEAHAQDPRIKLVRLSRNFGHQVAVTAGLSLARGTHVAVLDGDLQDPPELLGPMRDKALTGFDVVYAVRQKRKEGVVKRFCYWAFYRILAFLSDIPIPLDSGDFCVMSRRAVDTLNALPERHRFVRGLRSWIGYPQIDFPYERDARFDGEPKFTAMRLVKMAFEGIFTMSERPLRIATLSGIVVFVLALAASLRILVWRLTTNEPLVGYASTTIAIMFLAGLQLLTIGILGEYVARIHNEVKGRPVFVVKELVGFGAETPKDVPLGLAG